MFHSKAMYAISRSSSCRFYSSLSSCNTLSLSISSSPSPTCTRIAVSSFHSRTRPPCLVFFSVNIVFLFFWLMIQVSRLIPSILSCACSPSVGDRRALHGERISEGNQRVQTIHWRVREQAAELVGRLFRR